VVGPDLDTVERRTTMSKLVTGLFAHRSAAATAVDNLVIAGFSQDDISVLLSDESPGREFAVEEHTKAAEGAAVGAATGGLLGAAGAVLLAAGSIAVPAVGLLAAGPVVAALTGAGAGGTLGGVVGALAGATVPEHEAKLLSERIEKGHILVGVQAHDDRVSRAEDVLESAGGEHVRSH
jgi:hypothetical protein